VPPSYRTPANKRSFALQIIRSRSNRKSGRIASSPSSAPAERSAGVLVLARHGESEFNREDRFTGLKNPSLTAVGIEESINVGRVLRRRGVHCDAAFTSKLKRAQQSLRLILKELGATSVPMFEETALNERDYGQLSGLTREAARARWGAERVQSWRRSYDAVPPGGESLKMTEARTQPFFDNRIRPLLLQGRRILVVAHGNSVRSIVMSLEKLSPDEIAKISFATGTLLIYRLDSAGIVIERTEIPVMRSS
jgi:2,3-bisphosphoglycerate-dependent phosphoglycerate mutase